MIYHNLHISTVIQKLGLVVKEVLGGNLKPNLDGLPVEITREVLKILN